MPRTPSRPVVLTTSEVAERLGISTARVRALVAEGKLERVSPGAFLVSDVAAFEAVRPPLGRPPTNPGKPARR